ncbi:MAG: F-box protein [Limisphaerales bacterium]
MTSAMPCVVPEDAWVLICSHLSTQTLLRLRLTCREFRRCVQAVGAVPLRTRFFPYTVQEAQLLGTIFRRFSSVRIRFNDVLDDVCGADVCLILRPMLSSVADCDLLGCIHGAHILYAQCAQARRLAIRCPITAGVAALPPRPLTEIVLAGAFPFEPMVALHSATLTSLMICVKNTWKFDLRNTYESVARALAAAASLQRFQLLDWLEEPAVSPPDQYSDAEMPALFEGCPRLRTVGCHVPEFVQKVRMHYQVQPPRDCQHFEAVGVSSSTTLDSIRRCHAMHTLRLIKTAVPLNMDLVNALRALPLLSKFTWISHRTVMAVPGLVAQEAVQALCQLPLDRLVLPYELISHAHGPNDQRLYPHVVWERYTQSWPGIGVRVYRMTDLMRYTEWVTHGMP